MTDYEFTGETDWKDVTASEGGISQPEISESGHDWELFKNHREIITSMILASVKRKQGDICLLGPGSCNSIDVNQLVDQFNRVVLVDSDLNSLQRGLSQQGVLLDERYIELVGGVELTGIKEQLDVYARFPTPELMQQMKDFAEQQTLPIDSEDFQVAVSVCSLSKLMCKVDECVAEKNQDFGHLLFILRQRHIELMLDCLSPGGMGLLVTEFVSSDSLAEIRTATNLVKVLQQGIAEKNFLHGLNPQMIHHTLLLPKLKEQLGSVQISNPWRWPTEQRVYACMAFKFQKKA